jgi:arabinose-5-phosphate isomerase
MTLSIMKNFDFLDSGKRTITMEKDAVATMLAQLDNHFSEACQIILACTGRVVVTGMGKSGHVGRKIAATLASTGTPAFFVHPGEASHGDMGMITTEDVVIALSNSGNTVEVVTILPLIKRMNAPLITMTGNPESTLASAANVNLHVGVDVEACPLDLAPTSSTTVALVMGDALAIALLEARGFTAEDFAFSHPGGTLGKKLLLKVADAMHSGSAIPRVAGDVSIREALVEITAKGLGMTTIVDEQGHLLGIFTDGDLRRAIDHNIDFHNTEIARQMTQNGKTIGKEMLAAEALRLMEDNQITALVVTDDDNIPIGIVHLHDLLKAGIA